MLRFELDIGFGYGYLWVKVKIIAFNSMGEG